MFPAPYFPSEYWPRPYWGKSGTTLPVGSGGRIVTRGSMRGDRPFAGAGASLYGGAGSPDPGPESVAFRLLRFGGRKFLAGPSSSLGSHVAKTARLGYATAPVAMIDYGLTAELAEQVVYLQVRTFRDDVENETNFRPARFELDEDLEANDTIDGTARLLSLEQRDGGTVRLRFAWIPARTGTQPTTFTAISTDGPTSPDDVSISLVRGRRLYEIDIEDLDDSDPYEYTLRASAGPITKDLLTGIELIADATGPAAPADPTAEPW